MKIKKEQLVIFLGSIVILGSASLAAWHGYGIRMVRMPLSITAHLPSLKLGALRSKPIAPKLPERVVRLRLFADMRLHNLTITSNDGLALFPDQKKKTYRIVLTAKVNKVLVQREHQPATPLEQVNLSALNHGFLHLHAPYARARATQGELRITAKNNKLQIVNTLELETYVMGTVAPELGSFNIPTEAMKAQLIASRSYILALHDRHPRQGYDFCDSAHCQMFGGIGHYPFRFKQAAADTRGIYLTYKGKPASAFYHHSCGGQTAASRDIWPGVSIPYLRRVQDGPADAPYCSIGSRQEWRFIANGAALRRCFIKQGWIHSPEALDALRVIRVNASGRASQILVQSSRPVWVPADKFRHVINRYFRREVLLSTWFGISSSGDSFEFRGRGWGHGVGMCQVGAIYLARHHRTYRQILAHYFPGTQLSRLPESGDESNQ